MRVFLHRALSLLGPTQHQRRLNARTLLLIVVGIWLWSARHWIDPIGLSGDEACWATRLVLRWDWHSLSRRKYGNYFTQQLLYIERTE